MKLPACQRRFQHIARIHRAIGFTCTNHSVQLIYKQDDAPFLFRQIAQNGFQTLFKFAAIVSTSDQRPHIEGQHALMLQTFRHFAIDDALSQAFDDGGFTHARFADQHRVVFGTTLQHLNGTAYLFVTADNRVQFALLSTLGQIDSVFLQRLTLVFSTLIFHAITASHLLNGLTDFIGRCTGCFQQIGQVTAIFKHRQNKEFG